ncbi:MAG TPA: hypothetical protein VK826_05775, partial [Bacteroidia bacterium]|nr:hypothetical protein [Bacteroidia bacterium]
MNINVNNAEAFFLDYYEGTLSEQEVAEMFAFLKSNPALRETFESFADISVNTDETNTPDFSFLKKEIPVAVDEHEQAEIWMVDVVEGLISEEDRANLEKYFAVYPDKRAELASFEKTILRADANEKLEGLSGLKKTVTVHAGNFDDFAIASVEGTITAEEQELLNIFLSVNPDFKTQFENYTKTVSIADKSIRFEGKSSLKKSEVVVNASNIEEFLIAKMEGELAPHEEQAVDAFVAAHPEYNFDFSLLAKTKLQPDTSVVFDAKEKLKRGVLLINDENFEQHVIAASEGLLNGEELKAFNTFVNANPKHRKVVALYAGTRLQPDVNIVYENKAELKRKERDGIIWWSANMRVAAAAIVVIILGVYFWMKFGSNVNDQQNGNTIALQDESVNPNNSVNPVTNDDG